MCTKEILPYSRMNARQADDYWYMRVRWSMCIIRNYVPNWTTHPPAPTIAPTAVPIASTRLITHVEFEYSDRTSCGVFSNLDSCV